jgi:hypothetical protein
MFEDPPYEINFNENQTMLMKEIRIAEFQDQSENDLEKQIYL